MPESLGENPHEGSIGSGKFLGARRILDQGDREAMEEVDMRVRMFTLAFNRAFSCEYGFVEWRQLGDNGIYITMSVNSTYSAMQELKLLPSETYNVSYGGGVGNPRIFLSCSLADFDELWIQLQGLERTKPAKVISFPVVEEGAEKIAAAAAVAIVECAGSS